jgi:HEAT repeat protein
VIETGKLSADSDTLQRSPQIAGWRKRAFAWGFLGLGLVVLLYGVKLALGVRAIQTPVPVNRLIAQLKDRSLPISNRVQVCWIIAERGAAPKNAVPVLMEAAEDPSFGVRCTAVQTLGRIGPDAAAACPLLIGYLREWNTGGLSEGLDESYLSGSLALPPKANKARNIGIWLEALTEALVAIRPSDPEVIGKIAGLLDDKGSDVVAAGCRILSVIPANPAGERRLIQVAQGNDEFLKVSALCALGQSKPPTSSAIGTLQNGLSDPSVGVRECALDQLANLGILGAPAAQSIVHLLRESGAEIYDANYLLNALNPPLSMADRKQSNPTLEYTLPRSLGYRPENWPSHTRYKALRALAAIGPAASEAIPTILVVAGDDSDPLRLEAAVTAALLGAHCDDVLSPLLRACSGTSEDERRMAMAELKRIVRNCPGSVNGLTRGLEDSSLSVRAAALQSLKEVGTNALPALTALEKATHDQKLAIREMATRLVRELRRGSP